MSDFSKAIATVTLEQLLEIQWSARCCEGEESCCPVCGNMPCDRSHQSDCWLGNAILQIETEKS